MHLLVWIHLLLYHHTPNSSTARSQHHQHLYHLDPSTTLSDPSTMQTHMPPKAWHHPDSSTTQISVSTITKYHLGPTLSRTQNHSNPSTILTPASPKSQHHPDPSITQIPAPTQAPEVFRAWVFLTVVLCSSSVSFVALSIVYVWCTLLFNLHIYSQWWNVSSTRPDALLCLIWFPRSQRGRPARGSFPINICFIDHTAESCVWNPVWVQTCALQFINNKMWCITSPLRVSVFLPGNDV